MDGAATAEGNTSAPRSRQRGDAAGLREALGSALRADRWLPGERLPTERELAEHYGVARNTVRRALEALEDERLIVRHVGRGTFRTRDGGPARPGALEAEEAVSFSPADLLECRLIFEPEMAGLVVARASQADLDRMTECLKALDAADSLASFEHWDSALHDAIASATHNAAVISLSRSLSRARLQAEWGMLKSRSMTAERKAALQTQHRAIVAALCERDRAKARALLREHILQVQSYMFSE
jgi:DNA-binding FadR family transcriptional regulator